MLEENASECSHAASAELSAAVESAFRRPQRVRQQKNVLLLHVLHSLPLRSRRYGARGQVHARGGPRASRMSPQIAIAIRFFGYKSERTLITVRGAPGGDVPSGARETQPFPVGDTEIDMELFKNCIPSIMTTGPPQTSAIDGSAVATNLSLPKPLTLPIFFTFLRVHTVAMQAENKTRAILESNQNAQLKIYTHVIIPTDSSFLNIFKPPITIMYYIIVIQLIIYITNELHLVYPY